MISLTILLVFPHGLLSQLPWSDTIAKSMINQDSQLQEKRVHPRCSDAKLRELVHKYEELANAYDKENEYKKAESCWLSAIKLLTFYLPKNSPEVGIEYSKLSAFYSKSGKAASARHANFHSLQIFESNSESCPIELCVAEHNQAWLELACGRMFGAEFYLERCIQSLKHIIGPNQVLVALLTSSLADIYRNDGHLLRAKALYQNALDILANIPDTKEVRQFVLTNLDEVSQRLHKRRANEVYGEFCKPTSDPSINATDHSNE